MARVYGIAPWDTPRLTGREWDQLLADLETMTERA